MTSLTHPSPPLFGEIYLLIDFISGTALEGQQGNTGKLITFKSGISSPIYATFE